VFSVGEELLRALASVLEAGAAVAPNCREHEAADESSNAWDRAKQRSELKAKGGVAVDERARRSPRRTTTPALATYERGRGAIRRMAGGIQKQQGVGAVGGVGDVPGGATAGGEDRCLSETCACENLGDEPAQNVVTERRGAEMCVVEK
jgi:transposase-like protein